MFINVPNIRSRFTFAEPRVHALVYEPTIGIAKQLDVNFSEYIQDLRHVYDLYQVTGDNNNNVANNDTTTPPQASAEKSAYFREIKESTQNELN